MQLRKLRRGLKELLPPSECLVVVSGLGQSSIATLEAVAFRDYVTIKPGLVQWYQAVA